MGRSSRRRGEGEFGEESEIEPFSALGLQQHGSVTEVIYTQDNHEPVPKHFSSWRGFIWMERMCSA